MIQNIFPPSVRGEMFPNPEKQKWKNSVVHKWVIVWNTHPKFNEKSPAIYCKTWIVYFNWRRLPLYYNCRIKSYYKQLFQNYNIKLMFWWNFDRMMKNEMLMHYFSSLYSVSQALIMLFTHKTFITIYNVLGKIHWEYPKMFKLSKE